MKTNVLLSLMLSVFILGNLQAQTEPSEQEMEAFSNKFTAAYNQKSHASLQTMYTDDAVIVFPDGQQISGTTQVEAYFANQFKTGDVKMLLISSSIGWSDAEKAFVTKGTYKVTGKTIPEGEEIDITGAYANSLLKVGGEWKIAKTVLAVAP